MRGVDLRDPANPRLASTIPAPGEVIDVAAGGGYLYLALGTLGLGVLDVHDPAQPRSAATVPSGLVVGHVAVLGGLLLTAEPELGVRVLDASQPEKLSTRAVIRFAGQARMLAVAGHTDELESTGRARRTVCLMTVFSRRVIRTISIART